MANGSDPLRQSPTADRSGFEWTRQTDSQSCMLFAQYKGSSPGADHTQRQCTLTCVLSATALALCMRGQLTSGCLGAAGSCPGALVCGQHHHPLAADLQLDDLPALEALGLTHLRGGWEVVLVLGTRSEACG